MITTSNLWVASIESASEPLYQAATEIAFPRVLRSPWERVVTRFRLSSTSRIFNALMAVFHRHRKPHSFVCVLLYICLSEEEKIHAAKKNHQVSGNLVGKWVFWLSRFKWKWREPKGCSRRTHCAPAWARWPRPAIRGWRGGQCVPRPTGHDRRGSPGPVNRWF